MNLYEREHGDSNSGFLCTKIETPFLIKVIVIDERFSLYKIVFTKKRMNELDKNPMSLNSLETIAASSQNG